MIIMYIWELCYDIIALYLDNIAIKTYKLVHKDW